MTQIKPIQQAIPKANFPREEIVILSKMAISSLSRKSVIPRKITAPIINFGYLYLNKMRNNTLEANRFLYDCDFRESINEKMNFPKTELKALSDVRFPEVVEPIVHFGFNSLRQVDENESKIFFNELNKNVACRLKFLESNLFANQPPKHNQNFKTKLYNHLNHLCNLRHLLLDEDTARHHKQLDRLLTAMNITTPAIGDMKGLQQLNFQLVNGDLDDRVLEFTGSGIPEESTKFWE